MDLHMLFQVLLVFNVERRIFLIFFSKYLFKKVSLPQVFPVTPIKVRSFGSSRVRMLFLCLLTHCQRLCFASALQPSSSERIAPVLSTWPLWGRFSLTCNYNYSKRQASIVMHLTPQTHNSRPYLMKSNAHARVLFENERSLSHLKCKLK